MKTAITFLLLLTLCLTVAAQTTELEWQQEAMRRYPALAVKGSPLNNKFVTEYQRRKKLPSETKLFTRSDWPVILADQCARSLSTPTPLPPSPQAIEKPAPPGLAAESEGLAPVANPENFDVLIYVFVGIAVIGLLVVFLRPERRRGAKTSAVWEVIGVLALAAGVCLLIYLSPHTLHDRGYADGELAGRVFASSHVNYELTLNPTLDQAASFELLMSRQPGWDTEEYQKAYIEGFKKGYGDRRR